MWQAFNSIPLKEECKQYTRFITELGNYEYNRCPQGFLNSTDAYNIRLEIVLERFIEFTRRCVDDIIVWADAEEEMFKRVCEILKTLGDSGVVVNTDKLQYCQKEVLFAGYKINKTG